MFLRTSPVKNSLSAFVRTSLQEVLSLSKYAHRPATSKSAKITCWKCGSEKPLDNFFCSNCSALQEPDTNSSYFEVLGVDKKFDLQPAELTKKFRHLQSLVHPDKFSGRPKNELSMSENHSAVLNQAYSTLLRPLDRGLYLLKLHGVTIKEGTIEMDPAFLMEIMELNEKLEEAQTNEEILKFSEENTKVISQYIRDVDAAFKEKDTEKAKWLLAKFKYYSSLDEKIKELKRKIGIVS